MPSYIKEHKELVFKTTVKDPYKWISLQHWWILWDRVEKICFINFMNNSIKDCFWKVCIQAVFSVRPITMYEYSVWAALCYILYNFNKLFYHIYLIFCFVVSVIQLLLWLLCNYVSLTISKMLIARNEV